jgi:hypothetical protein
MYAINYLYRPTLITVTEVLAAAPIDINADTNLIKNSIIAAEERWITEAIGENFYQDFLNQKNVQVTSENQASLLANIQASLTQYGVNPSPAPSLASIPIGSWVNAIDICPTNYQNLWNRYLWQICAESVAFMAAPQMWARINAQGVENNNPKTITGESGSASISQKSLAYLIDNFENARVRPLIARMQQWICTTGGYTLFPYDCNKKDGINKKNGFVLGVYKNERPNGPNEWQVPLGYPAGWNASGGCGCYNNENYF